MMGKTLSALSALTPRRVFLVSAVLGGAAFIVTTPPFQVPDEPAHFYRAYSVSEGRLLVQTRKGMPGALRHRKVGT